MHINTTEISVHNACLTNVFLLQMHVTCSGSLDDGCFSFLSIHIYNDNIMIRQFLTHRLVQKSNYNNLLCRIHM